MFCLQVPAETPSGAYRPSAATPDGGPLRCGLWANGSAAWGGDGASTLAGGAPADKENLPPRAPALDVVDVHYRHALTATATAVQYWHACSLQFGGRLVPALCEKLERHLALGSLHLPEGAISALQHDMPQSCLAGRQKEYRCARPDKQQSKLAN